MRARIELTAMPKSAIDAMMALEKHLATCSLEKPLLELIKLRSSQLNGCAYCIDMHNKDARAAGEDEQRLYALPAWQDAPFYSDRERAALAWTEAVTKLDAAHVSDAVYGEASSAFNETELADLTFAVIAINGWNRLNVALRTPAGTYRVGQFG